MTGKRPYLMKMMKLIPPNTNLTLENKYYLQTGDTSMDTAFAPSYANISSHARRKCTEYNLN